MKKICGIYTITNILNGKMYVGYTNYEQDRKSHHKSDLRNNKHRNTHLQNAWNEYGEESFKFEIIEEYPENLLVAMEHYWATILNTHNDEFGYNIEPTNPNTRYPKRSEETRAKIREKRKCQIFTEEHRKALSIAGKRRKGIPTGKYPSQETRERLKMSLKESAEKRGYWKTPEQIEKTVSKLRGYKHTKEFKEGCRQRNLGKKHTEGQKEKIKEAVRKHYYKEFNVYNILGEYISTFGLITDAVKELKLTKHAKTGILSALANRQKSCQGFIFKYKTTDNGKLD